MTALARLQAEFAAWMREAPVVPANPRAGGNAPDEPAAPDDLRARVLDTKKTHRDILLGVYRDAYALRLIEVLETDFPGLYAMAGPHDFDLMARAYIRAHPSTTPSVRWFGRHLAAFLASTPPFDATPAAADMARFEWLLGEAFDAADAEPLTFEQLAGAPPEAWTSLRLSFVPSLRRATLTHQAPQASLRRVEVEPGELDVRANAADDSSREPATPVAPSSHPTTASDVDEGVDRTAHMSATGVARSRKEHDGLVVAARHQPAVEHWLIWRPAADADALFRSLAPDEAVALDAAREGANFPELCALLAAFAATPEAAAQRAAGLLRVWLDEGLIEDAAWD